MTIKAQAIAGVRWTTLSSIGRAALQFGQVVVLSRLLAPGDFGLIALVASTIAFLQIFSDAGVSNALIHHQKISREQISSIYWFNVACSTVLAIVLLLASHALSGWFGQPAMQPLLQLAALALVVTSLGQQLKIQAQKRLEFQSLAKVELVAAVSGFVVAVTLAWKGAGAISLMAGTLSAALVGTLLAWPMLAHGWRPQLRLNISEIKPFIRFGLYMIGNNLANTFNSQIDIFLGSKLLGATSVGLYSVPKELTLRIAGLINPIMTQVAFPVMAKAQDDKPQLRRIYLQIMRMTASVNFPIYVFMGFFAHDIVGLMLGSRWLDAVPLLQVLSGWALVRSTVNPIGSLLMACGRADISFRWNIAMLAVLPVAIWVGSQYGVFGMSVAMTCIIILSYWPNWRYQVFPLCGATLAEYSWQMIPPLLISVISAEFAKVSGSFVADIYFRLPLAGGVFVVLYVVGSMKFNKEFMKNIALLKNRRALSS